MRHLSLLMLALLAACPAETEETGDEIPRDADGDGFSPPEDCNDTDLNVHPGAPEACDGLDSDCDGVLLEAESDLDGDGQPDCAPCQAMGLWELTAPLEGDELAAALREVTAGFDTCNYSQTTNFMFLELDKREGEVECIYTGRTTVVGDEKPDPSTDMNTEHAWPRSQGSEDIPAKCDLHHLFPSDTEANQKRASHPFGLVSGVVDWQVGGSRLGEDSTGELVFEPRDASKGDIARAMLFFDVRYQLGLSDAQRELFVDWHLTDAPSVFERDRTITIGERQVSVNPLVVCPSIPERL